MTFLLLLVLSSASPDTALFAALDRSRAELKTLSTTVEIETPKPSGKTARMKGGFSWKAPNRYRIELDLGKLEGRLVTICDGENIFFTEHRGGKTKTLSEPLEKARKRLFSSGPSDPVTIFASPDIPLGKLFSCEKIILEKDSLFFVLRPLRRVPNYDRLVIETTRDVKVVSSLELQKNGKLVARMKVTGFRRNPPLVDESFLSGKISSSSR